MTRDRSGLLEKHAYDASIYITVGLHGVPEKGRPGHARRATLATVLNLAGSDHSGDKLDAKAKVRGMACREQMIEAIHQDRAERFKDVPESRLLIETAGTLETANWQSTGQQVQ